MTSLLKDKHTLEIAQKKIGKNNDIRMNITNMLQEFQILPSMFGFALGISFHDFLKKFIDYIIVRKFKINSDLLSSFIILLSIFIILYLFVYFIFYRFIYTRDQLKGQIIQQALVETKKEEVKKQFNQNKGKIKEKFSFIKY